MLINDSIDIRLIAVTVPDAFRIDNNDRAFSTPVKTSGLIDPGLPGSMNAEFLATFFGVVPHRTCVMILTASFVFPPVNAEKDVAFVVRHWRQPDGSNYAHDIVMVSGTESGTRTHTGDYPTGF